MSKIRLLSVFLLVNLVIGFGLHLPSTPVGTLATADEAASVCGAECWKPGIGTQWVCCYGHYVPFHNKGLDLVDRLSNRQGPLLKRKDVPCTCSGSYKALDSVFCSPPAS